MKRWLLLWSLWLAVVARPLAATAPWCESLACPGGGFWRVRVPVTVRNHSATEARGQLVEVQVGHLPGKLDLGGQDIRAIRLADTSGNEFLFDVLSRSGSPKRTGKLAEGDTLVFPVECPAGDKALFFVYADNPQAWPVPDFIGGAAVFANGGFEEGGTAPAAWQKAEDDPQHRLSWVADCSHSGKRCARCDVDPGAEPSWVKWVQSDVRVLPDTDYLLQGWVRAKGVKGAAGLFVHVHATKPMVINKVASAGEGTYEWQKVEIVFHTPPDARSATIGTVLRGTGTAWYDDVALIRSSRETPLRAEAGKPERRGLRSIRAKALWRVRSARLRVALVVRNWANASREALVWAPLRRLARQAGPRDELVVVEPTSGRRLPTIVLGERLVFVADLPPLSEKVYHLYVGRKPLIRLARPAWKLDLARLVRSKANLVQNPSFEQGEPLPSHWTLSAESDKPSEELFRAGVDGDAVSGRRCARLIVPPGAPLRWSGWHQGEIHVRPAATYLYAAMLRCKDVADGSVQVHGHFHNSEGKLCSERKYFGAGPALRGTKGWTLLAAIVQMPTDCASVQLHLTMNAHGTVWHDDVLFAEALEAFPAGAESRGADERPLQVWAVNPLVKVFREDAPAPTPRRIELAAARNEYEPLQLVVRSPQGLRRVRVRVETPKNDDGDALPPPDLNLVGYVPIDHPSSYYRVDVPAWRRKLPPKGSRGCDGWVGWWPDPLPPFRPFNLEPRTAQPVWLTFRVPEDAAAGRYRGRVVVEAEGVEAVAIPLEITVWDFTLPKETHLGAIYDFRESCVRRFYDARTPRRQMLERWYEFMAAHRVSPGILPQPRFRYRDGKVTMETEDFDWAAGLLDRLGIRFFYSPFVFYCFGWAHQPRKFLGFEPFTPQYTDAYTKCLEAYMDHLRAKGWADRVVLYISDEPHFRHEHIRRQMIRLCEMIRSVEPTMPIYSSTWRYCPEWAGHINVWGAGPHGSIPPKVIRERQAAGDTFWLTTDGHMCTDTPYLAIERLLPWFCRRYGARAYEFWGINWLTYDPWKFGWHSFISQSSDGVNFYYVRYPNGDGFLAYPGEPAGVRGPVSSIRLEAAREGLEDYEYFHLLDRLVAAAKERGQKTAWAEHILAEALSLATMPNRGGRYSTLLLPDPDAVFRRRATIATAIERLSRRLRQARN